MEYPGIQTKPHGGLDTIAVSDCDYELMTPGDAASLNRFRTGKRAQRSPQDRLLGPAFRNAPATVIGSNDTLQHQPVAKRADGFPAHSRTGL